MQELQQKADLERAKLELERYKVEQGLALEREKMATEGQIEMEKMVLQAQLTTREKPELEAAPAMPMREEPRAEVQPIVVAIPSTGGGSKSIIFERQNGQLVGARVMESI